MSQPPSVLPDRVPKRKPSQNTQTAPDEQPSTGTTREPKKKTCATRATRARHHGGETGTPGTRRTQEPSSNSGFDPKKPKTAQKQPRKLIWQPQKLPKPTLPHGGHGGRATAPRAVDKGISLSPVTAIPMTHRKAGVRAFSPWFNSPTDSFDQLPPGQGYPSPRTTRVRGRVQSIDWHRTRRDCTYCAHDRRGQQLPDDGGSAHSTEGGQRKQSGQRLPSCVKLVPCGDGPWEGQPGAGGVGVAPAGDVLRQHAEASPGCTQLQKEPYQIGCGKECIRIRTDGLHIGFGPPEGERGPLPP